MTQTITTREWTPSRGGQTRHYIQDWETLIGLDFATYKSGAISSATLRGEDISNRRAERLRCGRIWIGAEDRAVHCDNWAEDIIPAAEVIAIIDAIR